MIRIVALETCSITSLPYKGIGVWELRIDDSTLHVGPKQVAELHALLTMIVAHNQTLIANQQRTA